MAMTLSKAAERVIELSGQIRDYYDTELPKRYPNYPLIDGEEEDVPPPPQEAELESFLNSLPDELVFQLRLLTRIAWDTVPVTRLAETYHELKEDLGETSEAVSWLMTFHGTLAGQLSDGLEILRRNRINPDKLPLKRARTRKR
jgi:hypothetical protein